MDLEQVETYLCPTHLAQVSGWQPDWAWLAGGTWLFSEPQPDVKTLVDLTALNWSDIVVTPDRVAIGATCTLAQLQHYAWDPGWVAIAALKTAIDHLAASFKVTNQATVGGNLCLALPVGVIAPLMIAWDATYEIWHLSGRQRQVAAQDFQIGSQQTVLQPGEILRQIWIPQASLKWLTTYQRLGIAATDPALSLVAAAYDPHTPRLRYGLGACLLAPQLVTFTGFPTPEQVAQTLQVAQLPWLADARASAWYRQQVTPTLMLRAAAALNAAL
jgi:CO/xanthine dehydrogenase FAD-binding subunit